MNAKTVIASALVSGRSPGGSGDTWARIYAEQIVNSPQAHIDTLVEAGVLEAIWWCRVNNQSVLRPAGDHCPYVDSHHIAGYRVVQPEHFHYWKVDTPAGRSAGMVDISCSCGEYRQVLNRLPIEIPT